MIAGEEVGPLVKELEPNRRMLWWDGKGEFTWEWLLEPLDDRMTRLLTRVRETYPPLRSRRMLYAVVASSGDIVMVRKQLRGIKARAERLAAAAPAPDGRGHPPRPRCPREGDAAPQLRGATAAAGLMAYGTWTAVAWARYGHPRPERHPPDDLLDQFISHPEVDEYHQLEVERARAHHLRGRLGHGPAGRTDREGHLLVAGIILIRYVSLPMVKRSRATGAKPAPEER